VHFYPTFKNGPEPAPEMIFSDNWESAYFIRLSAIDAPGVLAKVAGCFAEEGVSIASMLQKDSVEDGRVPLIFITHKAQEKAMRTALSRLDKNICTLENMIRVEA
jgi:UTP:GlnB (protein PII) uridylyltransferase